MPENWLKSSLINLASAKKLLMNCMTMNWENLRRNIFVPHSLHVFATWFCCNGEILLCYRLTSYLGNLKYTFEFPVTHSMIGTPSTNIWTVGVSIVDKWALKLKFWSWIIFEQYLVQYFTLKCQLNLLRAWLLNSHIKYFLSWKIQYWRVFMKYFKFQSLMSISVHSHM